MFHIQKLYIWESVDHEHVYLNGIGKRGVSIRGGLLVTKECFLQACTIFMREFAKRDAGNQPYREAARKLHHREGEIEIDDWPMVSAGGDPGAYVAAWVWVSDEDLELEKLAALDTPSGVAPAEQKTPVIKRFKMVCSECGSERVLKDAYAIWSVEEQEWILHSTYDHADCEECGGECKVKEIVADDCQMNAEGFCSTHQKVHLRESSAAMGIPAAAESSERVDDDSPSVLKEWNMRCPECCSDEEIEICCNIWARLHTDGTTTDDTQDGSHEWNTENPAKCRRCDFSGKVLDFEIEQFTTDEERSNGPKKT
jgi:hypothetical protein